MAEPTLFLAFLAGVLTVTTPCIIPILPPMLAGSIGHRLRPIFIVAGSAVTFTLMGGVFSALGIAAGGFSGPWLRALLISFIIGFGAVMVDDDINEVYVKYSSRMVNRVHGIFNRNRVMNHPQNAGENGRGLLGAFGLGLSLGIVWIPCVGPILGSILAFAAIQENMVRGSVLLLVYSIGLGIPLLTIAYGGKRVSGQLEWTRKNSVRIKKLAGWILILTGLAMLFGIDRLIQQTLLPYAPDVESIILAKF